MARAPYKKEFSWSFSRIKNYENCGFRYQQTDVLRNFQDGGAALIEGQRVHDAFKERLTKGTPMPLDMPGHYEKWAARVAAGPGTLLVEQKLAITKEFLPCDWKSSKAWVRVVVDAERLAGDVALAADWKTGKIIEDSVQLAITAQVIFSHHPQIKAVRADFIWLREDENTSEVFYRTDMAGLWTGLLPRVAALEEATKTNVFFPKPGYLCERFCPVISCPHHGKRQAK